MFGEKEMTVPCWCLIEEDGSKELSRVDASAQFIRNIIDAEVASGRPRCRIAVGGFSQGATLSAWTMCHLEEAVAGALLMSGGRYNGLMKTEKFAPTNEARAKTSILILQGEADPFCPPEIQHEIHDTFQEKGFADVKLKKIPNMVHSHFGGYEYLQQAEPDMAKEEQLVGVDEAAAEACAFLARVLPPVA